MNEQDEIALIDKIFDAAGLGGPSADTKDHKDTVWIAGLTLLTDTLLRSTDELDRERRLRGLPRELRTAITRVSEIRQQPVAPGNNGQQNLSGPHNPYPFNTQ
jgi:hypothetical protein